MIRPNFAGKSHCNLKVASPFKALCSVALERLLSVDGCRVNGINKCASTKCRVKEEGATCDCNANKCLLSFLVSAPIERQAFSPSAH